MNVSYNTKDVSYYTETPMKLYLYGQLKNVSRRANYPYMVFVTYICMTER